MARYDLPARKALLVDARQLDGYGLKLKDGVYLVTPDLRMYEGLYKQCVADYFRHGLPLPYAIPSTETVGIDSGQGPMRKIG
jgi:hypothetical protein